MRGLDRIAAYRGYPLKLKLDNGSELISLAEWADARVHQTRQTDEERFYQKVSIAPTIRPLDM